MNADRFKITLIVFSFIISGCSMKILSQYQTSKGFRKTWYSDANIRTIQIGDTLVITDALSLLKGNWQTKWEYRRCKHYRITLDDNKMSQPPEPEKWKTFAQKGQRSLIMKSVHPEVYRVIGYDLVEFNGIRLYLVKMQ